MINSIIEVKCRHCNRLTKIDVNSITQLQDRIKELEKELSESKENGSSDLSELMGMFGMK